MSIEFNKVKNYRTFWVILGLYAVLVPIWFVGLTQFISNLILGGMGYKLSSFAAFPDVWQYLTWTTAWWNILLGILVVILTCNEIVFKTERQNIIDGLSRGQLILSKFLFLMALAVVVTLYTALVCLVFGLIYGYAENILSGIEHLFYYFMQTVGYFSLAYFMAVLIRKSALAIILYLVIFVANMFWEPILGNDAAQFVPSYTISALTPFPFFDGFIAAAQKENPLFEAPWVMPMAMGMILSLVYISIFFFIGFFTVKKRDL